MRTGISCTPFLPLFPASNRIQKRTNKNNKNNNTYNSALNQKESPVLVHPCLRPVPYSSFARGSPSFPPRSPPPWRRQSTNPHAHRLCRARGGAARCAATVAPRGRRVDPATWLCIAGGGKIRAGQFRGENAHGTRHLPFFPPFSSLRLELKRPSEMSDR